MSRLAIFFFVLVLAAGCASYRNTSLDSRLPEMCSPELNLASLKSVQSRKGQNPDVAIALAISGGGHRAANLAAGIMLGLESISVPGSDRNLLQEVDYLSTVSGGGFAAGVYVSSLHDFMQTNSPADFLLSKALYENNERRLYSLRRDYQSSVLASLFNWKCYGFRDSGDLMERSFNLHLLGGKARTDGRSLLLGDIFKPRDSREPVLLPYWIANATVYENGDRFMFVPAFVSHYRMDSYVHNMKYYSLDGCPFDLPLAVGMKASASFPVIFPASTFGCNPEHDKLNTYLHLVDGGLTDNLGVTTALELLAKDRAPRKVLLVIDAYAKSGHPYSAHQVSPDGAGVAFRIMKIGLDSEHIQLRRNVNSVAAKNGINVQFFGFDQLKPATQEALTDIKAEIAGMRAQQSKSRSRRFKRELRSVLRLKESELDAAKVNASEAHTDSLKVATSLHITRAEQAVLLRTGQAIVHKNKKSLLQAISQH